MTNLTEKWKNKELKWHKSYYCKNKKGDVCIAILMGDDVLYSQELGGTLNFGYWEVLAHVPSYEELQKLESDSLAKKEGEEIVAELKNENAKLKRLLKTCKSKVIYVKSVRSDARKIICDDIVYDIDEVLR